MTSNEKPEFESGGKREEPVDAGMKIEAERSEVADEPTQRDTVAPSFVPPSNLQDAPAIEAGEVGVPFLTYLVIAKITRQTSLDGMGSNGHQHC